jgi:hypothetical protein
MYMNKSLIEGLELEVKIRDEMAAAYAEQLSATLTKGKELDTQTKRVESLLALVGKEVDSEETPQPEVQPQEVQVEPAKAPKVKKVKRGPPPRLIEACQRVMGITPLHNNDIFLRLKENGWLPNSSEPKAYVRQVLSANPDIFLRSENRGFYHLSKGNQFYSPENDVAVVKSEEVLPEPTKKAAPKPEVKPLATPESQELVDDLLREFDAGTLTKV